MNTKTIFSTTSFEKPVNIAEGQCTLGGTIHDGNTLSSLELERFWAVITVTHEDKTTTTEEFTIKGSATWGMKDKITLSATYTFPYLVNVTNIQIQLNVKSQRFSMWFTDPIITGEVKYIDNYSTTLKTQVQDIIEQELNSHEEFIQVTIKSS